MKKFIALVLAVVMCVTMSMGVMAESKCLLPQTESVTSSGYTYGPWFGGIQNEYFCNHVMDEVTTVFSILCVALAPYVGNAFAQSVAGTASAILDRLPLDQVDYVYGYIDRTYREVYINGSFAYYQTKHTVDVYNSLSGYVGTYTDIYSGDMLMNLPEATESM